MAIKKSKLYGSLWASCDDIRGGVDFAKMAEKGMLPDITKSLNSPGMRAPYDNLGHDESSAVPIDERDKRVRSDDWRGNIANERAIKRELFSILNDEECRRARLFHREAAEGVLMESTIQLGEITANVVFKEIKNVHLSVYSPTGHVPISAPVRMSLDSVRAYAFPKLEWIKAQQIKLRSQERVIPRDYVSGENHFLWGKRYLLKVVETEAPQMVTLRGRHLKLRVRPDATAERSGEIVEAWLRSQLKAGGGIHLERIRHLHRENRQVPREDQVTPRALYESSFTDINPLGPDGLFESGIVDQLCFRFGDDPSEDVPCGSSEKAHFVASPKRG